MLPIVVSEKIGKNPVPKKRQKMLSKKARIFRNFYVGVTDGKSWLNITPRGCKGGTNGTEFRHSQIDFLKLDIFFCPILKN
mgnify:CR=1 FL=1